MKKKPEKETKKEKEKEKEKAKSDSGKEEEKKGKKEKKKDSDAGDTKKEKSVRYQSGTLCHLLYVFSCPNKIVLSWSGASFFLLS